VPATSYGFALAAVWANNDLIEQETAQEKHQFLEQPTTGATQGRVESAFTPFLTGAPKFKSVLVELLM